MSETDPAQRALAHTNQIIHRKVQEPSELRVSRDATLAQWDRTERLGSITMPTLVIGAGHDTMDSDFIALMGATPAARQLPALPGRQPPGDV